MLFQHKYHINIGHCQVQGDLSLLSNPLLASRAAATAAEAMLGRMFTPPSCIPNLPIPKFSRKS
jgi:hypothetical protein